MRATARWTLVAAAVALMLGVLGTGPRTPQTARATQPDVYQALGGSSAVNLMGFDTGSPVDPAPAANEAFPLTSITADNGPASTAHAAYVEPPATAQAATGLNNVPVPYATAVDAQCNTCDKPRTADADGTADQKLDGGRVEVSGGKAHAQANLYAALATAGDGAQRVAPFEQVKTLFDALVQDLYTEVLYKPGNPTPAATPLASPPCATAPAAPGPLSTFSTVCSNDLPLHDLLVSVAASDSSTQVTTDSNGTLADSTSQVNGAQLLDGLIGIGSLRTEARALGDGSAAGSSVHVANDIQQVCVAGDCSTYTITAQGVCTQAESHSAPLCENDQLNRSLRQAGFNVCRLGTSTSKSNTDVAGTAAGVLVEFHAVSVPGPNVPPPPSPLPNPVPGNGYAPDPTYYSSSLCEAAPPAPKAGWAGISIYAILGSSSVQLHTDVFPSLSTAVTEFPSTSLPGTPAQGGTTVTTIVNNQAGGGVYPGNGPPPQRVQPSLAAVFGGGGGNDRRPLMLTVFGLLELILLSNLTAMARNRRRTAG